MVLRLAQCVPYSIIIQNANGIKEGVHVCAITEGVQEDVLWEETEKRSSVPTRDTEFTT